LPQFGTAVNHSTKISDEAISKSMTVMMFVSTFYLVLHSVEFLV